jgi:hypothetical protein
LPGFQKGKFHLIVGQPATRDMNVPISWVTVNQLVTIIRCEVTVCVLYSV